LQKNVDPPQGGPRPRICMPTSRKFAKQAFQCGLYEAQDILLETDDVDLICLEAKPKFNLQTSWLRRALYHDVSKQLMFVNPGLQKVRLTRDYDLFIAVCQNYWDILHVNAIPGWKEHCKTSVCWIDEIWAKVIPGYKQWLHALSQFDHIFVGPSSSVAALSDAISRPCHWLPGGVDAVRFSPNPDPPARVIDVYSIGRRWEGIHGSLLAAAQRKDIFYVHDTFAASNTVVHNHQEHRNLLANMAKRSRYFVVAPAKMDSPGDTRGQVEIGYRYYEGAAAGAVMVGEAPECESFAEMFPWPDVVVPLQPDGSDVLKILAGLDSDPERSSAISRRNVSQALLRHDWVYRWEEILRLAGLVPSARMMARKSRLKELSVMAAAPPASCAASESLR